MLLRRPAKLKAGRPLHTPGPLAASPSLNPCCETSPQILLGGAHSFERHKSTVSPFAWQSNKALLFSVQFSSVAQSCLTLCNPMDCSRPGLPVHHQLPEFTQTHVHWVGDAIQTSHPLSSPSPPAFNFSQHQGLFQGVSSSHQVAKVLEFQLQHQSFQWTFRTDFLLGWTGWISLQSKGLSRVFSNTTVQKLVGSILLHSKSCLWDLILQRG